MAAVPEPHIVSSSNEYKLNNPPADLISNIQFAPDGSKFLLTSSWDSSVRLYELGVSCTSTFCRSSYQHQGPVLDCTFLDNPAKCASAGLDNFVKMYDFNSSAGISISSRSVFELTFMGSLHRSFRNKWTIESRGSQKFYTFILETEESETILGAHEKPVRCVEYNSEMSLLITGSWDSTIKLWDSRTARCTSCLPQSERVYTITVSGDRLIVGTAGRKVYIWNLRNMAAPEQKRDSSLKYQTRCIRAFPNKQAFVLASIEGRVAVEYIDADPEIQKRKYAFKCHRLKDEPTGQEFVYPVNAVAFHPIHNTFATGGSDSLVNIWDPFNKKRLCQFHKIGQKFMKLPYSYNKRYPTSISALAFSADGSTLAIAASYQYEQPENPNPIPEDAIFVRKLTDQETRTKI